jgi:hypothetical protein
MSQSLKVAATIRESATLRDSGKGIDSGIVAIAAPDHGTEEAQLGTDR